MQRPDRGDVGLDWLVCTSKACSLLGPLSHLRVGQHILKTEMTVLAFLVIEPSEWRESRQHLRFLAGKIC